MESGCCVLRKGVGIVGKTVPSPEYAEATRKKPNNHNRPLSHSRYAHPPNPLVSAPTSYRFFFALKLRSLSLQDAALFRLPGAYSRSLQAQIQACVVLSALTRALWLTWDLQRRVSSNSRRTSSISGLVISSISRPTEPSKRACHINTTMGSSQSLTSYHAQLTHLCSRTGIVYNVTPRAVGVIINKIVGNRYIEKRVNIRVEHIRHSKCRQEFLDRVKRNTAASAAAKKSGGTAISTRLCQRVLLICWFRTYCPQAGTSITPYQPHRLDGGQHSPNDCPCSLRDYYLIFVLVLYASNQTA